MREAIHNLEASKIREVANAGMGRDDVLAFWFGESDEVTPEVVRQAAIESLQRGETFYAHNLGLPELREAIARYSSALHPTIDAARIAVTSGGVSALMLAVQALVDAGDDVVAVTPVWPNLTAQPAIMGAHVRTLPLVPVNGQWTLDLPALRAAVTSKTKLLIVNAPNNPTGWTMTREEQQAVLDHCRQTGTWILADEVYERLYFEPTPNACAPSFLDISKPDDRLVVTHSFSKSFLMTGWRLGWLVLPPSMVDGIGKLIEFNTSCASVFTQRAAIAAIEHTAEITPRVVAHLKQCRDTLVPLLAALPGVQVAPAKGGMYAFFRLEGFGDSLEVAKRLVAEAGLGLAPGNAFAPEAQGWLRWCFASKDPQRLVKGVERLRDWLARQK
ncbi:pyridoxal phosphate-dependent aminotransferase [Variovorax sp. NFACC27]|uniref:pyridoxal phosphate-dependent aminotransferase n=1 Tax=unclassified Variovorax TaxID=663243 RepID=UPI00089D9F2D|nr:pyridoxal phosphate-dependent aminotransferase [Variovorax sp. YR750]MDP9605198.1 aspartate/methionine/tyrosine aminotransferase [Variovorax paradoxus]SEF24045.1 Aspartate/methionine/tyrosine aminotransferase [Variovorax sp. NFACC28]SEG23184.1 Aspartate/methionine/tyrosine aminotransferase [Variovorax sp. NFACC29]SFC48646.1 Aspartate/methionine/tyrosine aminotransferase [Variovorax sp. NFACC26]SFF93141.1 Aspartate/methionine/tyrosine aminotransferase [Variovorax sp. NFACC27]